MKLFLHNHEIEITPKMIQEAIDGKYPLLWIWNTVRDLLSLGF